MTIAIVGAGPAGLTAAIELQRAGIKDITIIESDSQVGGISKTFVHNGNRIDIGGHRFFSKSEWVMNWWQQLLPIQPNDSQQRKLRYQGKERDVPLSSANGAHVDSEDQVMLVRDRLSRIYFNRNFFAYPLKLNLESLRKLGPRKTVTYGFSYVKSRLFPIKPETSLEDFLVNRFGRGLYRQFFKEYTEKVWGVPCDEISADWGAQRIKSLSITKALLHAARQAISPKQAKATETSLIESFLYPKFGPGQMWETAARIFVEDGGRILMNSRVEAIDINGKMVRGLSYRDPEGALKELQCTHLVSTMPIKDLIAASSKAWNSHASEIGNNLEYRDFITVGLLYTHDSLIGNLKDNWIYIQEPGVNVGRVQVFNNWSPHLVAKAGTTWLGLEFFCKETDALWNMPDSELAHLAHAEMLKIGLVRPGAQVLDKVVLRVPKAYPGYFGEAYKHFVELRSELDSITNLFLIGRNGMHRYNNQDHSMLTAKAAAEQIVSGNLDKSAIWNINIDDEYHEEKSS